MINKGQRIAISQELTQAALRTSHGNYDKEMARINPRVIRLLHAAVGMVTEAAEFLDMLKKHIYYGKPIDINNAIEEIGDCTWYERLACDELEIAYIDMIDRNLLKLKHRYPDKFSDEQALNRDIEGEQIVIATGAPATVEVREAMRHMPEIDVVGLPLDAPVGKITKETRGQ